MTAFAMMPQQLPPNPPPVNVVDGLLPTNPLAAVSCWLGIIALITCVGGPLLGPIALVLGILSLKRGAVMQESRYGKATSTARSWIGIVTGALATIMGLVFVVMTMLKHR
jgi:hypothetical protein